MNGPILSTVAPIPTPDPQGHVTISPIQTAPAPQSFPPPLQEAAEVFADDRIVDPIDQSVPSMPTHATMQDFSGKMRDIPSGEEAHFSAILQGLLSNMSVDPLAVEKNTSLAMQYLDTMQKKLDERETERQRKQDEEGRKAMEEAMNNPGLSPYFQPMRPPMQGSYDPMKYQPLTGQPQLFKDAGDEDEEFLEEAAQETFQELDAAKEGKDAEPSSGPEESDAQGA